MILCNINFRLKARLACASAVVLSLFGLVGCGGGKPVECVGISKKGADQPILMSSGLCKKLAYSKAKPATATQAASFKKYPYESYVKCYGVAAAGMNDCGTSDTACGGSVHTPARKDAWVAIPKGICEQVKNGVAVMPKKGA